ncbi:YhdH/YhfP family quinone oxidoreductase [Pleionea litopenaei]|uniref:YhdH/YhfP family quinone oxidoreductase n=1 Tax=Pleionea litopenaei TaxID=3070815 RepID=A0AA51RT41_9GAMM|nr:YhdH/YhfP family quinone oxidoreductase [Pleionea sp. HL-JVS1]WMS87168.1 YhdH/YhfP family quinone oxidoreductase [Pleionea sp. HL-JVS1]
MRELNNEEEAAMSFLACRVSNESGEVSHQLTTMEVDQLTAGDVVIKVEFSGINYKDALAATGRGKIMKQFPLNAGIDLAGEVVSSESSDFKPGQKVVVNGCGLGEQFDGGLAAMARVSSDFVMPMPDGLDARLAMTLGTAGFTAALALHRMQVNDQTIDKGPIVVTGASGGVGSIAVNILASQGYEVIAVSGRPEHYDFLTQLGASQVCSVDALELGAKPLEKGRFGGVIDNVGGELLAKLLAHTNLWGNVASIGLASSHELDSTVFPFILRGVSLLGVSSTNCPMPLRRDIWKRLGQEWLPNALSDIITDEVALSNVSPVFSEILDRKRFGRVIVNCQK